MSIYSEKPTKTSTHSLKSLSSRFKMNDRKKLMEMTKKKPKGHNIGGTSKQKRRKERKGKS